MTQRLEVCRIENKQWGGFKLRYFKFKVLVGQISGKIQWLPRSVTVWPCWDMVVTDALGVKSSPRKNTWRLNLGKCPYVWPRWEKKQRHTELKTRGEDGVLGQRQGPQRWMQQRNSAWLDQRKVLQSYWCLSQCGQHRVEGWKPADRRLSGEQVITKSEFMDFPLDKRKNWMETEGEIKTSAFVAFSFIIMVTRFLCLLIKGKEKRGEKKHGIWKTAEGQEFEVVKSWRR